MGRQSVRSSADAPVSRRDLLYRASTVAVAAIALGMPRLARAETRVFEIEIKDGKVVGAKSVRVTQGDKVILNWTSDKAVELHLHGYDIERRVGPDHPAAMSIDASATGRFPVEVHTGEKSGGHGHAALFHLEVYPK